MKSKQPAYRAAYWQAYRKRAKPYVVKLCALCGQSFTRGPGEGGNAKTCIKCRLSKCVHCGQQFNRGRLAARFCSNACKDAAALGKYPPQLAANPGRKPRTYAKTRGLHGSAEDREWRVAVFERDNYTCVLCNQVGGRLQADHIKPYADHPKLRHVLTNGRTLCVPCHQATPTYGWGVYWQRKRKALKR